MRKSLVIATVCALWAVSAHAQDLSGKFHTGGYGVLHRDPKTWTAGEDGNIPVRLPRIVQQGDVLKFSYDKAPGVVVKDSFSVTEIKFTIGGKRCTLKQTYKAIVDSIDVMSCEIATQGDVELHKDEKPGEYSEPPHRTN